MLDTRYERHKMTRYKRNMRGYGQTPPAADWPHGANIAIQVVLNYEEGGENSILHGDPSSEAFLSEIVGATAWPEQRNWNMESIYEYGARAGFWRLHRLFTEFDIPVTVFGVATALARNPEQTRAMQSAGWEIASHGFKWIEHKGMSPEEETAHITQAIKLHSEVTGERPTGWYTGRCSKNTINLVSAQGGFEYISDSYADDLPYWVRSNGEDQLIVPYTLDANDMRFATPQGFNSGDQFFTYLKDSFDALYSEGAAGQPKMFSIGLHCRLIGRPGRIMALRRFIEYAKSHSNVWFTRRVDIARYWQTHHPAENFERPSEMMLARFVELYGNIFEHSPWIAQSAFELELGPAHDTAIGLHNALARIFRAAGKDQRLAVLRAHPDLAGKLARAKRLTQASNREQASAGLDALTDGERQTFENLNKSYTGKHGFSFIIAVGDNTKSSILAAFKSRVENTTEIEFEMACKQIERISELRLKRILP
jgi:OHCU decarboxylase